MDRGDVEDVEPSGQPMGGGPEGSTGGSPEGSTGGGPEGSSGSGPEGSSGGGARREVYWCGGGSHLPGEPVDNDSIETRIGRLEGEAEVRAMVLKANGIRRRYYAQDDSSNPTDDVYGLAASAVGELFQHQPAARDATMLAVGTTHAPLVAPGVATITHSRLAGGEAGERWAGEHGAGEHWDWAVETVSHAGVCCSAAAAILSAVRAVRCGDHGSAIAVGAEHASAVLKADAIRPIDDRNGHAAIRDSRWFMSVFLRFMLSDGAAAWSLRDTPVAGRTCWRIDDAGLISLAHRHPRCMWLDGGTGLLTQDLNVLRRHLIPAAEEAVRWWLADRGHGLEAYDVILPHLSSFFFARRMRSVIDRHTRGTDAVPVWTNLDRVGNTGAASILLMFNEFAATDPPPGTRALLFVPESGQFSFALIAMTAVAV